jgi:hypothetical protein
MCVMDLPTEPHTELHQRIRSKTEARPTVIDVTVDRWIAFTKKMEFVARKTGIYHIYRVVKRKENAIVKFLIYSMIVMFIFYIIFVNKIITPVMVVKSIQSSDKFELVHPEECARKVFREGQIEDPVLWVPCEEVTDQNLKQDVHNSSGVLFSLDNIFYMLERYQTLQNGRTVADVLSPKMINVSFVNEKNDHVHIPPNMCIMRVSSDAGDVFHMINPQVKEIHKWMRLAFTDHEMFPDMTPVWVRAPVHVSVWYKEWPGGIIRTKEFHNEDAYRIFLGIELLKGNTLHKMVET